MKSLPSAFRATPWLVAVLSLATAVPFMAAAQTSVTPQPAEIDLGGLPEAFGPMGAQASQVLSPSPSPATSPAPATASPPPAAKPERQVRPRGRLAGAEHLVFKRRPLPIALAVGEERLITFPGPVALRVPAGSDAQVSLTVIGGTVYATAREPIASLRIVAEDLEIDGQQYPLDLRAVKGQRPERDEVQIHPETHAGSSSDGVSRPESGGNHSSEAGAASSRVDAVALTRYAAQMLYAPRRLAPRSEAIRRVEVPNAPVPGLYRGARIETTPVGGWKADGLQVTAVRFVNQERVGLELDLDQIRGQWLTATAQHIYLAPQGDEADTTVVYLVCTRAFNECR